MQELNPLKLPLSGTQLIEASAGTGKTYTISTLFLRLLLEKKLTIEQILVVTFTEAATKELRDRIRKKLAQAIIYLNSTVKQEDEILAHLIKPYLEEKEKFNFAKKNLMTALRNFDEAAIFTIHSFCRKMLKANAFESGELFDTQLISDQSYLVRSIVQDFWRKQIYGQSPFLIQYLLNHGFKSPEDLLNIIKNGNYIGQKFLEIIPNEKPHAVTQELENKLAECYQTTKNAWLKYKDELHNALFSNSSLNGNKYKTSSFPKWFEKVEHYFLSQQAMLVLPEELEKFNQAYINQAVNKGKQPPTHPFFLQVQLFTDLHNSLTAQYEHFILSLKIQLFEYVEIHLKLRKKQYNLQSFNDLLSNLHTAIVDEAQGEILSKLICKQFNAALIDEFQDTDPLQWDIFKRIYQSDYAKTQNALLLLIGDPKQAIYSFRGADIFTYLQAKQTAAQTYTLATNWRSEPRLIDAVNQLFQQNTQPFLYESIEFYPVKAAEKYRTQFKLGEESPPVLHFWLANRDELNLVSENTEKIALIPKEWANENLPHIVAAEIKELLEKGQQKIAVLGEHPIVAGDIAILVRTNKQALHMQKALSRWRIPSVLYSHESVFSTLEALELQRLLLAITEPQKEGYLKAALTTELMGLSGNALLDLVTNDEQWQRRLQQIYEYHQIWLQKGFMPMFRYLLVEEHLAARLLHQFTDGERRLTNLLHLVELIHKACKEERLSLLATTQWLSKKIQESQEEENKQDEQQLRLESDEKRVKIITIHKSKGLEYNIVFCPFSWESSVIDKRLIPASFIFHDKNCTNKAFLEIGSENIEKHWTFAQEEQLAESLRLFYVAITRAKYRCYLVWGAFSHAHESPLGHLLLSEQEKKIWRDITDVELRNNLKQLIQQCSETIAMSSLKLKEKIEFHSLENELIASELKARQFKGKLDNEWRVSSFSALTATQRYHFLPSSAKLPQFSSVELVESPEHDMINSSLDEIDLTNVGFSNSLSIESSWLHFPYGRKAGDFIHYLFEKIDFTKPVAESNQFISEAFLKFGYSAEQIRKWQVPIENMLNEILNTSLSSEKNIKLNLISREQRLNELEFYLPLTRLEMQDWQYFFQQYADLIPDAFVQRIKELKMSTVKGFLKGFIDMIFEHDGKYYLVDYKSNFLGKEAVDYQAAALQQKIAQQDYFLQYYLYSVALHRYLKQRKNNYCYEHDFGGIFYLFVRGMHSTTNIQGVYYDKPAEVLIEAFSQFLTFTNH